MHTSKEKSEIARVTGKASYRNAKSDLEKIQMLVREGSATHATCAKFFGVSRSSITRWLNGTRNPGQDGRPTYLHREDEQTLVDLVKEANDDQNPMSKAEMLEAVSLRTRYKKF